MATSDTMTTGFELRGFEELRPVSNRLMTFGVILSIIGVLAVLMATFSTIFTVALVGVVIFAGGIMQIAQAFSGKGWSGFFLHLLLGVLYVVAGFLMITRPAPSAVSLTLFLGAFFLASGAFRAVASAVTRFPSWGWTLLSGVITFILGLLVLRGWPSTGLWAIGLFVGIDLIFAGGSLMAIGAQLKRERRLAV